MTPPQPLQERKPPVCRRLFADEIDNEPREVGENRENRFVEDLHQRHVADFKERYNFDPQTETPLPGNFEWYERTNREGEWHKMAVQQGERREHPEGEQRESERGGAVEEPMRPEEREDNGERNKEGEEEEEEEDCVQR